MGRSFPGSTNPRRCPRPPKRLRLCPEGEDLDSWITPNDKFFANGHYDVPTIDEKTWRLDVAGLVSKPLTFTVTELRSLPRQEVTSTIECAGNNGLPFLTSAVGNARWAGASLAAILRSAQVKSGAFEVVFFGADQGEEVFAKEPPSNLNSPEISREACRSKML